MTIVLLCIKKQLMNYAIDFSNAGQGWYQTFVFAELVEILSHPNDQYNAFCICSC